MGAARGGHFVFDVFMPGDFITKHSDLLLLSMKIKLKINVVSALLWHNKLLHLFKVGKNIYQPHLLHPTLYKSLVQDFQMNV